MALAELDDEPMAGLVPGAGVRGIIDAAFAQSACGSASSTKSPMPIWCANWSLPTWA